MTTAALKHSIWEAMRSQVPTDFFIDKAVNITDRDAAVSLDFGDSSDVSLYWTSTGQFFTIPVADNTVWNVGTGALGMDLKWYGSTGTRYIYHDASADVTWWENLSLRINDYDTAYALKIGDSADILMYWTSTGQFYTIPAADSSIWNVGSGTAGMDLKWYGSTGTRYFYHDASADVTYWENCGLRLNDYDAAYKLAIGDSSDVAFYWTSTGAFYTIVAADNTVWNVGSGTAGVDFKVFASTGTRYTLFDASADLFDISNSIYLKGKLWSTASTAAVAVGAMRWRLNSTGNVVISVNTTGTTWKSVTAS